MTVTTEKNTSNEEKEILFIDSHVPSLTPGDYTLTVNQEIKCKCEDSEKKFTHSFSTTLNFSISGPRFSLDPQEIQSVFPPEGSLGDHSNVLPHIILKRSTLPWERNLLPNEQQKEKLPEEPSLPWLALLLFEEREFSYEQSVEKSAEGENLNSLSLKELKNIATEQIKWPGNISLEPGQQESDRVSIINVPWNVLKEIIPTGKDLKYLSHVRKSANGEDELAVIIGNRLPASGVMSTVHLVSLEGRYAIKKIDDERQIVFDDQNSKDDDLIRLVSLKSWRFACLDHKQSFKGLLMHLNHQFLFNIQNIPVDSSGKISAILSYKKIPVPLISAFQQNQHSLDANTPVECSEWKITDQNRIYLISDTHNVYNQAGKFLFKLQEQPHIIQENKVTKTTQDDFSINNHTLSNKVTIDKIQSPIFWWLNTKYFITLQNDILYVYYLDPDSSSTLRLPALKSKEESLDGVAERYLKMGCVPLPHAMRQGNKTVSWYRGPLVPGSNQTKDIGIKLPIRSADELVSYNSEYGMFDVSYAAAWELGRLLALQSKSFSVSLYNWKCIYKKLQVATDQLKYHPFAPPSLYLEKSNNAGESEQLLKQLPFAPLSLSSDLPQTIRDWFNKLALLEGVPFNYLVPDERLLPPESIRFFQIDKMWMKCLLDGASSIGRTLKSDLIDEKLYEELEYPESFVSLLLQKEKEKNISGFLIRSDVVSGWPNLLVDGYNDKDKPLPLLRKQKLSKNILICLFDGVIGKIDLHLKPESLHFGLDFSVEDNKKIFYKELRNDKIDGNSNVHSWRNPDKKIINVTALAQSMAQNNEPSSSQNEPSSSQFALWMIEGVEKVSFKAKSPTNDNSTS